MIDKRMSVDAIVDQLRDGMTIAIGGWATRRKPMALVRAIARSDLKDLTVIAYGGPDVGMLAACGKLRRVIFAFVSMDQIPIEPHFKAARQAGLDVWEMDEGMLHWGLRAAAMHLPFLPTRVGIGTAIAEDPRFKTITSPYGDGETLIAMPAIKPDVALLHVHRSDEKGNVLTLSPDPFFDELMARAADKTFVTAEQIVSTAQLDLPANARYHLVERPLIAGVAEAPFGAHPTSAAPDYQLDLAHLRSYAAAEGEAWDAYRDRYVAVDAPSYLAAVGGADALRAIAVPIY
ncbi:CoA transferase subunit A [Sphingomonas populi]|uniref:CoA transferase subunit A n=1 Tax=Sphingomonas populi TaxID=2484750 RepID=A0A4Q6XVN4_9SPHN|nr:CoA-transferase [Sphingomonas populi]RZF64733.1 CoA transferase subunit A [Sphingomonas populi]